MGAASGPYRTISCCGTGSGGVVLPDHRRWVCGFRCPPKRSQGKMLERTARRVISTLEIQCPRSADGNGDPGRAVVKSSRFSLILPQGWERQDFLGAVFVYAPGRGYRARIGFPAEDPDEAPWESVGDQLEYLRLGQGAVSAEIEFDEPRRVTFAGRNGMRLNWPCRRRTDGLQLQGMGVVIPYRRRGATVWYLARSGRQFNKHLPALE